MNQFKACLFLLFANISAVLAFAPQFNIDLGAAHEATAPMLSGLDATVFGEVSNSMFAGANSLVISVVEEGDTVTKQGVINWDNPGEAIFGSITLLYFAFSIAAGIKYVVVDGYRPKM